MTALFPAPSAASSIMTFSDSSPQRDRRRGLLVIISSPSGAGKTTLAHRLIAEFADLDFSVSYTTRPARPGEKDGQDYHFVSVERFAEMVQQGAFAEWAEVHGNRYGTARQTIDEALQGGRDVVFDVDWQGGQQLSAQWPEESLKVFVLPPDMQILEDRLRRRASDSAEVIARRLAKAKDELLHHPEYEHLIINDELERAYRLLRTVYCRRRGDQPISHEDRELLAGNDRDQIAAHARALVEPS